MLTIILIFKLIDGFHNVRNVLLFTQRLNRSQEDLLCSVGCCWRIQATHSTQEVWCSDGLVVVLISQGLQATLHLLVGITLVLGKLLFTDQSVSDVDSLGFLLKCRYDSVKVELGADRFTIETSVPAYKTNIWINMT